MSPDVPETAVEMARAVASGEVSAATVAERALARLEAWQPVTNAFSAVLAEEALAGAARIDRAIAAGEPVGPLSGVPVAVKDLFDVAGAESTGCCRAYAGRVAHRDAELVRRLREAGAVVVGKTNQHELACGSTNLVSACGPTRNPWDPERITGGSSGGSGAAAATGVVPLALGTDTGGSIRMPCSLCGCWGLKPTHGRFPANGMMPLAPSLDCPGPIAGSARDLTLWWEATAGALDASAQPLGRPFRAGVLGGWFREWTHPEVWGAVKAVGTALAALRMEVDEADGNGIEDVREVWLDVAWPEFAQAHGHLLEREELLLPQTAASLRYGTEVSPGRREAARRRVAEYGRWFGARLARFDLLVAPSTPIPAPRPGRGPVEIAPGRTVDWERGGGLAWFTEPVNLAGLPSLAVPAGRSSEGLPLGVQVVARRGADELLLAVARRLEEADERFRPDRPAPPS